MAGSVRTLNRLIARQTWSVAFPPLYGSIESDTFNLEGNEVWKFHLQTECVSQRFEWRMYIKTCDNVNIKEKFCLIAYVRHGTWVYCMAHKEIATNMTLIWTHTQTQFQSLYPGIKVDGKIDFTFVIVHLRGASETFVNGHQPVQTPSYSDDRLCLNNLSVALRKLVDEGLDSDVQLKCGECSIAAHKIILGVRSEVFRTMLQSDMLEKRKGVIEIVDMEPKVCEIFIRYLYTGSLPVLTEDTATSLYEAADKYHVEALMARCGDFLAGNLTRENALRIFAMAGAHGDNCLKDKIATYVLNEKIPSNEDEWSKFCDDYPKLAIELLNRSYKHLICLQ